MSASSARKAEVVSDPYRVAVEMDRLGITEALINESCERGHVDRVFASPLNFAGHGEYVAGSMALRHICEEGGKLASPWHRDYYLGIPVAFNLDETIAITVTSGDEYAGIDGDRDPKTRPDKGPNAERAAKGNLRMRLVRPADADDDSDDGVDLWYVLTFVNEARVRIEISKSSVVKDGRVTEWIKRIILGGVDLESFGRQPVPAEPTAPVVVDPVRRTSG